MIVSKDTLVTDDGISIPVSLMESGFNKSVFSGITHFDGTNGVTVPGKDLTYINNSSICLYYQAFASTGTFTVPAGVNYLNVIVCGAGGSDGVDYIQNNNDGSVVYYPGGDGGVGGMAFGVLAVTSGASITATIGASGANINGGTSSFGSISATGGTKGGNAYSNAPGTPGTPGTGSGGSIYNGNIIYWSDLFTTYLKGKIDSSFSSYAMYQKLSQTNTSPVSPTAWSFAGTYRPGSAGTAEGVGGAVIVFWSV